MVVVTTNWRLWLAGMAVSLGIFAVLYFTVIQPSTNTANQAVKTGLQQSQQALNQAQKQISNASSQASGVSQQASTVSKQASQQINAAAKLAACVQGAGTDVVKIQACQTKFAH